MRRASPTHRSGRRKVEAARQHFADELEEKQGKEAGPSRLCRRKRAARSMSAGAPQGWTRRGRGRKSCRSLARRTSCARGDRPFSLLLPANREKRLARLPGETRNQRCFKDLRETARVEGEDGTGRLFSLFRPITGREPNNRMRGPARERDHQELQNSPAGR